MPSSKMDQHVECQLTGRRDKCSSATETDDSSCLLTDPRLANAICISRHGQSYLVFSASDVMRLRREFNICAVFVGSTPLAPSQNSFLSLPLQLMPEEVHLLLQKGVAYVVDGPGMHASALASLSLEKKTAYIEKVVAQRNIVERLRAEERRSQQAKALEKVNSKRKTKQKGDIGGDSADVMNNSVVTPSLTITKVSLTPTCSFPDLIEPPFSPLASVSASHVTTSAASLPDSPSVALYAYLHSRGYFSMPGIRFGCDFTVYPGDPFRFHAHFLATSFEWNEEINLLQVVGPGRLATAVKKGYVIAANRPAKNVCDVQENHEATTEQPGSRVRAFSIEWAGF